MPKKINARSKGSRGERELADTFSTWWGVKFNRTPSSGAYSTIHARGSGCAGDISCDDPQFPWCIECKRVESVDIAQLFNPKALMYEWWTQACKSAALEKKVPLLVFRKNGGKWYFVLPEPCMGLLAPDTLFHINSIHFEGGDVVLGLLNDLLKTDPNQWRTSGLTIKQDSSTM